MNLIPVTPLDAWIAERIGQPGRAVDRACLDAYHRDGLRRTLGYVRENSPFYRERLSHLPAECTDLQSLPFTTAADIREDGQRMICLPQDEIERIITLPTSGTTGQPKRIYFSAQDQELTVDFFRVGMSTLAKAGDRVLVLFPAERPGSVGALLRIGLERLGCTVTCAGLTMPEGEILQLAKAADVNVIAGAPAQILRLAAVDEVARVIPTAQIRAVLSSSDVLYASARDRIERIWGCEVFDHFGMTETGLGGGVECGWHAGSHLREADMIFEIVDPLSGQTLPPGERGELVFTTLSRDAMPLIRYRCGDLSRLLAQPCRCGSQVMRLEQLGARPEHHHPLPDGTVISLADIGEILAGIPGLVDFSCELNCLEGVDTLAVSIFTAPGCDSNIARTIRSCMRPIKQRIPLKVSIQPLSDQNRSANSRVKRVLVDRRKIEQ
jgi:phenylacetate-CoA ligase